MKRLFSLVLALVACAASLGRADTIDFSYTFSALPTTVPGGTGTVSITPYAGGSTTVPFDGSHFAPAFSLTSASSALGTLESPADNFSSAFSVTVGVTDAASGMSHDFVFNGMIEGNLTQTSSTLTASFTGELTGTANLGTNQYTVSIDPATVSIPSPQPPVELLSLQSTNCLPVVDVDLTGGALEALISAQFSVTPLMQVIGGPDPVDPNDPQPLSPPINEVPEPTTLLLSLLAGPAAWLLRRRVMAS